jgi:hypothetical protein
VHALSLIVHQRRHHHCWRGERKERKRKRTGNIDCRSSDVKKMSKQEENWNEQAIECALSATCIVLGVFIGVLLTMRVEVNYGLWCQIPQWKRDLLCEEAYSFTHILESRNVTAWLSEGDGIGMLRGGELIPWEWVVECVLLFDLSVCMKCMKD